MPLLEKILYGAQYLYASTGIARLISEICRGPKIQVGGCWCPDAP